jgi:hypothetical protein
MVRRWARDELRTKQARFDFAQSKIDSEDIVKAYEFRKKYPQLYDKLKEDKTSKKLKFKVRGRHRTREFIEKQRELARKVKIPNNPEKILSHRFAKEDLPTKKDGSFDYVKISALRLGIYTEALIIRRKYSEITEIKNNHKPIYLELGRRKMRTKLWFVKKKTERQVDLEENPLYPIIRKALDRTNPLATVEFPRRGKYIDWNRTSTKHILAVGRKMIVEAQCKNINQFRKLGNLARSIERELVKRGQIANLYFEDTKTKIKWREMTDEQVIGRIQTEIEVNCIGSVEEFRKKKPGLLKIIERRKIHHHWKYVKDKAKDIDEDETGS